MSCKKPFRATRLPILLLLLAVFLTAACDDTTTPGTGEADVTVMTRNLYLGGDIFQVTQASSPMEIPALVAQTWAMVVSNNYFERAGALAAEIEAADPHLIGLQEVSLFRIQDPGDYLTGVTEPNATEVYVDFLEVLLDSLAARGLSYDVVSVIENADVELPAAKSATEFFDVRLTDHDVILARSDVATRNPGAAPFDVIVPFEVTPGDTVWFERGYVWADATVDGVDLRFVNTHLEVSMGGQLHPVQSAQANQLAQQFVGSEPVILAGDFNTQPGDPPYNVLMNSFTDAWTALGTGGQGLTCCFPDDLSQTQDLYSRIDLILYRGNIEVLSAEVIGANPALRTPSGLWPSDHAGVVATLRVRN